MSFFARMVMSEKLVMSGNQFFTRSDIQRSRNGGMLTDRF